MITINGVVVAGKGAGVPKGGTAGQVLSKKSATDYDTQWIDPPSGGDQPSGVTEAQVDEKISTAINGLIDGAPTAYDTLKEISDYIATDKNAAEAMELAIGDKVSKATTVNGKALNSNITLSASDVNALSTSGGEMTGNIKVPNYFTIESTATQSSSAGGCQIVVGRYSSTKKGPFIRFINNNEELSGQDSVNIGGVSDPIMDNHAANKKYVDDSVKDKVKSSSGITDIVSVTQDEYNALTTKSPTTLYLIKE